MGSQSIVYIEEQIDDEGSTNNQALSKFTRFLIALSILLKIGKIIYC